MPETTLKEETASVGSRKANVHSEKHAHSSMTRTRKAKGRPSPTGSPRRSSKGDWKGSDDQGAEDSPRLIGKKSVRESEQSTLYKAEYKKLQKERFM